MKLVGVSGTNGSGKDTIAEMLEERHNFLVISATDLFAEELKKRGLPTDRKHKSELSAEWRRKHGLAMLIEIAVQKFKEVEAQYSGIVVGSLRHPAEAEKVTEYGGFTVWVDADPKIRYARVTGNVREGRSSEDQKSFEDWIADEQREMTPSGDSATISTADVKKLSQVFIENNGDNIEAFKDAAEAELIKLI